MQREIFCTIFVFTYLFYVGVKRPRKDGFRPSVYGFVQEPRCNKYFYKSGGFFVGTFVHNLRSLVVVIWTKQKQQNQKDTHRQTERKKKHEYKTIQNDTEP